MTDPTAPAMTAANSAGEAAGEAVARLQDQTRAGLLLPRRKPEDGTPGENHWLLDIIANFKQVMKNGALRLRPIITRLADAGTLKKMGRSGWDGGRVRLRPVQFRQKAPGRMTSSSTIAERRRRLSQMRRAVTGAALLLAGVGLAGCWMFPAEWNEKLTVTIATPQGDVSGSAVRWQTLSEDPVLRSAHARLGGEAVVVEVAKGRYLFALLQQYRPQTEILFFPDEAPLESAYKLNSRKGEVLTVPREMYPMLVTFGNLSSPASVQEVDPANLAATFGPGYALKSITLEITDEPVTKGVVEKVIPWLSHHPTRLRPPSLRLGPGLHDAADVLPIEKIEGSNFRSDIQ